MFMHVHTTFAIQIIYASCKYKITILLNPGQNQNTKKNLSPEILIRLHMGRAGGITNIITIIVCPFSKCP